MPMFRSFVPTAVRPWIYVLFALSFQLTGGVYLGALDEMIGARSLMREDILMCMYANLAGMAIYFPLLFRMKFRFTNKTLLLSASLVIALCNLSIPHIRALPLVWLLCFICGCAKIQGTFECMSNIQLWITPRRDFRVFFPVLHIFILCSIELSTIITTYVTYYYHWTYMQLFIAGLMLTLAFCVECLTRHVRIMPRFPLYGIDWLGAMLWALLFLEITFFFNYGDWYDWFHSPVLRRLALVIIITLIGCIHRMLHIRHPFYAPKMWGYRHLVPILLLITIVEAIIATQHVLEEIFYEVNMGYSELTLTQIQWYTICGTLVGCLFALLWLKVWQMNYLRLLAIGFAALSAYLVTFYLTMGESINIEWLYLPVLLRGFGYAVLAATIMLCLEEVMTFEHFFQALSVFNMLHMMVGGVIGAAFYATLMRRQMADNVARFSSYLDPVNLSQRNLHLPSSINGFTQRMMLMSEKQIFGYVAYVSIAVFLVLLLCEMPKVRHTLKRIPSWKSVGRDLRTTISRLRTTNHPAPSTPDQNLHDESNPLYEPR